MFRHGLLATSILLALGACSSEEPRAPGQGASEVKGARAPAGQAKSGEKNAATKDGEEGKACSSKVLCAKGYVCVISSEGETTDPVVGDKPSEDVDTGKCEKDPCAADPSSCDAVNDCPNGYRWDANARDCVAGEEAPDCNDPSDRCADR